MNAEEAKEYCKNMPSPYVNCSICGKSVWKYVCTFISDEVSLTPVFHTILCPNCKNTK